MYKLAGLFGTYSRLVRGVQVLIYPLFPIYPLFVLPRVHPMRTRRALEACGPCCRPRPANAASRLSSPDTL